MRFPFALDPIQVLWSGLFLVGFWFVLGQATDPLFARKFASLIVALCVLSWIVYEGVRLHLSVHRGDEWFLFLPKVLVFWIALSLLFKNFLFHKKGMFPLLTVSLTTCYLLVITVGLYLTFLG